VKARILPIGLASLLLAGCTMAPQTLRVGPGQRYERPSQAAAAASYGDTVLIAPGQYHDCAVWRRPGVTIMADGGPGAAPVEILGPACDGKALFVTAAPRITIVGITFRGAKVPDGNGAGIRAEGGDLTIRNSRFEDNENGILTADAPDATLVIEDSVFRGNGALVEGHGCAHGLYAGYLGLVVIRRSHFEATHICHHVKSRAGRTAVLDSIIEDTPAGDSSYLIDVPNGGDLLVQRSVLRKGPNTGNNTTAIAIGFEGVSRPTKILRVLENTFENLLPNETAFVSNRTEVPVELGGNRLIGQVKPLVGPGTVN
jgi:hypothetical protein